MRKAVRTRLIFVSMILLCLFLTSCSGRSSKLVGRWISENGGKFEYLEFYSDGKYNSNRINYTGEYSAEGGRMQLSGILEPTLSYRFEIKGHTLYLFEDDSSTPDMTLVKEGYSSNDDTELQFSSILFNAFKIFLFINLVAGIPLGAFFVSMKDRKENASVCQQVKAAQSIQSEQHRVHRFESTQGLTIKRHSESPDIIPQDKGFGGRLVFIIKLVDQSDENSFWEIRTDTEGSIGRADHCSVTLHDDSVSRVHCKIMVQNGEPVIVDVNSSNHTLLNGESLKGISPIYLGDTIQIGRKALKVAAIEHIQVSEAEENRKEDYPTEFLTGPVTETLEEPKYRVVLRNQNNMIDRWEVETNSEVTIGRDENCSIVLHDGSVSRIHCKISITDIGAEIADKESVNHTFVNGKRLDNPAPLMVGDVIRVGRQTLVIAAMEKLQ